MKMIAITISMGVALSVAVFAGAPYPPSPVITDINFGSQVYSAAGGSDNWPCTWADDGHLYTSWGDGKGFSGSTKVRLGIARIEGNPPNLTGKDISTPSVPQNKGRGILMVGGILYLSSGQDKATIAWSADHGKSWTWPNWDFKNYFGYLAFINFGQNYADARDGYVYIYAPDIPSAYSSADTVVLMRVPKGNILDRNAYEFFKGMSGANPTWSQNINERVAVMSYTNACNRLDVVYNAPLKRYILANRSSSTLGTGIDTFSIFDAPEPWGPWTTVYNTTPDPSDWENWPGESAHFPSKWISSDGKTMYMVNATNDSFKVQKVTLTAGGAPPPPPPPVDTTPPAAPLGLTATPAP